MSRSIVINFPEGMPKGASSIEEVTIGLKYLLNATMRGRIEVNIVDVVDTVEENSADDVRIGISAPWHLDEITDEAQAVTLSTETKNPKLGMLFRILSRQGIKFYSALDRHGSLTGFIFTVKPNGCVGHITGPNETEPGYPHMDELRRLFAENGWTHPPHLETQLSIESSNTAEYDETDLGNQVVDFVSITFAMMGASIRGFRWEGRNPYVDRSGFCWTSGTSSLSKAEIRLCANIVQSALELYPDIAAHVEKSIVYEYSTFSIDDDHDYVHIILYWKNPIMDSWFSKIKHGYPF